MIERQVDIATKDGKSQTFIVHPDRGGPHPVILFLMDAPAIREELRDMARRFASSGYYVMLPNLYYRAGVLELSPRALVADTPERQQMADLMNALGIRHVMEDCEGMLAFADKDKAANAKSVGAVGYCMSGRFAVVAGGQFPDRVKATASIYGTRLVTEKDNSPHLIAKRSPAEFYFACAETDVWAPPEVIAALQKDLAGANGEVEVYPGAHHGFAFPQRQAYNKAAAEQHWERVLSLFARNLH
jgi:carboxymethylenebutenolidase